MTDSQAQQETHTETTAETTAETPTETTAETTTETTTAPQTDSPQEEEAVKLTTIANHRRTIIQKIDHNVADPQLQKEDRETAESARITE